jgi:NitT/TauT family transport system substrate-binding protein
MRTRRSFVYGGLAAGSCLAATLTSCTQPLPVVPLRVGLVDWPGYELFYLAQSLGFYDKTAIEFVNYTDITEQLRAYRQQQVNCLCITFSEVIQLTETLNEQRLVMVIDQSAGADAIVSKPGIKGLADLKGKRVGSDLSSLSAYMLVSALKKPGLTLKDIELVNVGLADQAEAYRADRFDAVVTFDPVRTQLLKSGAKVLFDSSQIPNEVVDVMLVSQATINQDLPTLKVLTQGFFKALDYLQQQPQEAINRMATREKITPDEFAATLKLIKLSDRGLNQTMLDPANSPLLTVGTQLNQVMIERKIIQKTINVSSLLTNVALSPA